jgi:deoxyribodipyrimidine photo-lyase
MNQPESDRRDSGLVPGARIRARNGAEAREEGRFVLYWMIAGRRTRSNFALQRAVEWCETLGRPLVILEALRCGYRWASDRIHRFVLDGMADNLRACEDRPVVYYPYVEPENGAGKGLLAELGRSACVVVTDDFPCFMLPRMVDAAARELPVLLEDVDGNGLFPMRAADRTFPTAHSFRRFLHANLPEHLGELPDENPLSRLEGSTSVSLPRGILRRWPAADRSLLEAAGEPLPELPIDHDVEVAETRGGSAAAEEMLADFLDRKLDRYDEDRNRPEEDVTSGLSPYLHFGHISVHEVFRALTEREEWSPDRLAPKPTGARAGWWGMSGPAESFLDELVTWRELGYNMCARREDYDRYESLPDWARATLEEHRGDRREHLYELGEFEAAETHDPLWNAAQNQLVREGRMHNYLRMLWGKKILEWTASPREALDVMIELNNKYALDGRNPNSYSGIFWVLGRYDRAWGPERKIFGKIRYMSSQNTARKFPVQEYIDRYS